MIRYFTKELPRLGATTAKLYGINTFGAVLGTILAGFFLILWLGVKGTIYFAAGLNLFIGFAIFLFWRNEKIIIPHHSKQPREKKNVLSIKHDPRLLLIVVGFFLSGFAAIALEVLWTRVLIYTIGTRVLIYTIGSLVYTFSIIVAAFLFGIALGSILIARFIDSKDAWNWFGWITISIGTVVVLLIPLLGNLPLLFLGLIQNLGFSSGSVLFVSALLAFLVFIIPTTLMGITFPAVVKIITKEFHKIGTGLGRVYFFNTIGGVAGSLAAGFLFIPVFGVQKSMIFFALIYLVVGASILLASTNLSVFLKKAIPFFVVLLIAFSLTLPSWNHNILQAGFYTRGYRYIDNTLEEAKTEVKKGKLLFYKEGSSGTVVVKKTGDQQTLSVNGKVMYENGIYYDGLNILLGHLPMLFHKNPKEVLMIGLGGGITLGAITQYHEAQSVDVVEINSGVVEAAFYFGEFNNNALDDPRVKVITEDGRNFVLRAKPQTYDLIISSPTRIWIGNSINLYTKEFFELTLRALKLDGIAVHSIDIEISGQDLKSLVATFQSVFPHVVIAETVPTFDFLLLGSKKPLSINSSQIQERLERDAIRSDLKRIGITDVAQLIGSVIMGQESVQKFSQGAVIHTDDNPFLAFSTLGSIYMNNGFNNSKAIEYLRQDTVFADQIDISLQKRVRHYSLFQLYIRKAQVSYFEGDLERALLLYDKAQELYPENQWVRAFRKDIAVHLVEQVEAL